MPDQPQIPYSDGPFTQAITPTIEAPQTTISGWTGTGGQVANIAANFLAGVSKGRATAFARSEQQRNQNLGALQKAAADIQNSSASDEIKQQQLNKVNQMMAQMVVSDHSLPGSKKDSGGDPNHPANHVLNALRGIATNMLGPGAQKQKFDPDQIKGTLYDVYQSIGTPQNSATAQNQQVDQKLGQVWDEKVKANRGKPLSVSQIQGDPDLRTIVGQAQASNGGKGTPGLQRILGLAQEVEKQNDPLAQARVKSEQATVAEKEALTRQADAAAGLSQQKTKELQGGTGTPPGSPKITGQLKALSDAYQIQANPNAPDYEKKAAAQVLREKTVTDAKAVAQAKKAGAAVPPEVSRLATAARNAPSASSAAGKALIGKAASDPFLDTMAFRLMTGEPIGHLVAGRGKEASAQGDMIGRRMGQLMSQMGISPEEAGSGVMKNAIKANASALAKVTTQGAMVENFEGTLQRNVQNMLKLSNAYERGDTQFINRIQNAIKTGKGDPEAVNLAAQIHAVANEWAKINAGNTGAGGVAISESEAVNKIMNATQSKQQLQSLVTNVILPDAKNRSAGIAEEQQKLLAKIRNFGKEPAQAPTAPGTQPPPTSVQGRGGQQAGPPQTATAPRKITKAEDFLKKYSAQN